MTEFEEEEEKSRSQLKREYKELKELVAELVELPSGRLRGMPLTDGVRAAILAAQELERYPLKRQIGHIASRMDGEDVEAIRDTLSGAIPPTTASPIVVKDAADHRSDELIEGDDEVLSLFIDDHPYVDRQHLRQLVRNAQKERELDQPTSDSAEQLVDYLRSLNLEGD